jgi:hypothetical protein
MVTGANAMVWPPRETTSSGMLRSLEDVAVGDAVEPDVPSAEPVVVQSVRRTAATHGTSHRLERELGGAGLLHKAGEAKAGTVMSCCSGA